MHSIKTRTREIILFFTIITVMASCGYTDKTTKLLLDEASTQSFDMVVVPGIQLENGRWDSVMKGRVYWSKYLYDKGIAKNIMYSGSSVYSPYYEGVVMAMYAEALGIPKEHIYSETKAEHSTENIYYSYKKAKQLGFNSIALASDKGQTKLLARFSRNKLNGDVTLIPMVIDSLKTMYPSMTEPVIDFQPAYNKDFISITKREGLWKRLRGTLGKNIDTTYYR